MTNEEILLSEGAAYFGNRLIYRGKDVGVVAPGVPLVLTSEGETVVAWLSQITDVEVKPAKTRTKKAEAPADFVALEEPL